MTAHPADDETAMQPQRPILKPATFVGFPLSARKPSGTVYLRSGHRQGDAEAAPLTIRVQARLAAIIGRHVFGRPLKTHGWESLIVPLLGITLCILLLIASFYPLWSKAHAVRVASHTRVLQHHHTLAATPPLLTLLGALTPPHFPSHTRVSRALHQLCAVNAPNEVACEAEAGHSFQCVIASLFSYQVGLSARPFQHMIDTETARVEFEYARANKMAVELGVRSASSKPFHAAVKALDRAIVTAVKELHTSVDDAEDSVRYYRKTLGVEMVVSKWMADRESLAQEVAGQGMHESSSEVIAALDEAINALLAWKDDLDATAAKWRHVQEWVKSETGVMWWVPRHLWDAVYRLEGYPEERPEAVAGHQGEL